MAAAPGAFALKRSTRSKRRRPSRSFPSSARAKAREHYADLAESDTAEYLGKLKLVKKLESDIVRKAVLKDGTRIDGRLQQDAAGNLIVDGDVRRLFDYFLSAVGAEPLRTGTEPVRNRRQGGGHVPFPPVHDG